MSRLDLYFEEDGDGEHDVYELRIDDVTVVSREIISPEDRAAEASCRALTAHLTSSEWVLAAAEILFPEFAAEHPEIIPPL